MLRAASSSGACANNRKSYTAITTSITCRGATVGADLAVSAVGLATPVACPASASSTISSPPRVLDGRTAKACTVYTGCDAETSSSSSWPSSPAAWPTAPRRRPLVWQSMGPSSTNLSPSLHGWEAVKDRVYHARHGSLVIILPRTRSARLSKDAVVNRGGAAILRISARYSCRFVALRRLVFSDASAVLRRQQQVRHVSRVSFRAALLALVAARSICSASSRLGRTLECGWAPSPTSASC